MEAKFQRDGNANYMILEGISGQGYTLSMLINNRIEQLLPFHVEYIDNKQMYYYEITSKQTLSVYLERKLVTKEFLFQFVEQLIETIGRIEEYLLEDSCILLSPEVIYLNLKNNVFHFCYYPNANTTFETEIKKLFQYLLEKVDYQKREDAAFLYSIHKEVCKEGFCLSELLETAKRETEDMGKAYKEIFKKENMMVDMEDTKRKQIKQLVKPEIPCEEIWQEKEVETSNTYVIRIVMVSSLAIIGLLASAYLWFQGITWTTIIQTIGGILIAFAILVFFIQEWKKQGDTKLVSELHHIIYQAEDEIEQTEKVSKEDADTILLCCETDSERYLEACDNHLQSMMLSRFPFYIGKVKEQVDGVILDISVSRIHAKIEEDEGRYYLTDLNSTNGVMVNGKRLLPNEMVQIEHGYEIIFGKARFIFR